MAKCRLGEKKLAKCRAVTGKPYRLGFVRGGWEHFVAECVYGRNGIDMVNWQTGEWEHVQDDADDPGRVDCGTLE